MDSELYLGKLNHCWEDHCRDMVCTLGNCMYIVNAQIPHSHEHTMQILSEEDKNNYTYPASPECLGCKISHPPLWQYGPSAVRSVQKQPERQQSPEYGSSTKQFTMWHSKTKKYTAFGLSLETVHMAKSQPRKDLPIRMLEFPSRLSCCTCIHVHVI